MSCRIFKVLLKWFYNVIVLHDQVLIPFFIEKIKQCLTRWEFFKIKKEKRLLIQLIELQYLEHCYLE